MLNYWKVTKTNSGGAVTISIYKIINASRHKCILLFNKNNGNIKIHNHKKYYTFSELKRKNRKSWYYPYKFEKITEEELCELKINLL